MENVSLQQVDSLEDVQLNALLIEPLQAVKWRIDARHFIELFIVKEQNQVEGIGISWTNPNHPTAKYIQIIATSYMPKLMKKLLQSITPYNKTILSCWEYETEKLAYMKNFGFHLFRKTYIESYAINELLQKLQHIKEISNSYSLQQITSNSRLEKELFSFVKTNYEQTHLHNEAKNKSWELWRDTVIEDTPDMKAPCIIVDEDKISAYMFVHPVGENHVEIGWMGKANHVEMQRLLKTVLLYLVEASVETVEFEIDTTDYFAYELADLLELENKASWHSYMYHQK
ncbi:hypothetical protein [Solibacillus daqui]|uniref:hypothetical protein n=1 Tax=Solibacillus daqui TaxID=2912187 RepID=UPI0023658E3B|nr:hypothetical protein [Solibacillus daqui]